MKSAIISTGRRADTRPIPDLPNASGQCRGLRRARHYAHERCVEQATLQLQSSQTSSAARSNIFHPRAARPTHPLRNPKRLGHDSSRTARSEKRSKGTRGILE